MVERPVQYIPPRRHGDAQGWLTETYNRDAFAALGIDCTFVQDNHSFSTPAFTLRELHFHNPPRTQAKLVRCIRGRIYDAVDIRRGSPTRGRFARTVLSAENGGQLFVPTGFAHGFLTLEADCEVVYKCSDNYAPESEGGIAWDSVGIDWPMPPGAAPALSDKDKVQFRLQDFGSLFSYDGRPLPLDIA